MRLFYPSLRKMRRLHRFIAIPKRLKRGYFVGIANIDRNLGWNRSQD
jgi:hypothetical protein